MANQSDNPQPATGSIPVFPVDPRRLPPGYDPEVDQHPEPSVIMEALERAEQEICQRQQSETAQPTSNDGG